MNRIEYTRERERKEKQEDDLPLNKTKSRSLSFLSPSLSLSCGYSRTPPFYADETHSRTPAEKQVAGTRVNGINIGLESMKVIRMYIP